MSYNVLLTSAGAPNGIGEYWWEHPDTVVSVPDDLALQLLKIPAGGYAQVDGDYKALPERPAQVAPVAAPKSLVDSLVGDEPEPPPAPISPAPPADGLTEALNLVEAKNEPEAKPKPRGRPRKAT